MKYLAFLTLLALVASCSSPRMQALAPNHIGITPSFECEFQEGNKPLYRPIISTTLDWDF